METPNGIYEIFEGHLFLNIDTRCIFKAILIQNYDLEKVESPWGCDRCGGRIIKIKPCKIRLDYFYGDERDFQFGFEGICEDCGEVNVWVDV